MRELIAFYDLLVVMVTLVLGDRNDEGLLKYVKEMVKCTRTESEVDLYSIP